jgi:hypothetical protein
MAASYEKRCWGRRLRDRTTLAVTFDGGEGMMVSFRQ